MSSVYYSVLKKKIIERDLRSVAEREEVYAQARAAVINRLWSYDPPPSEDEIDARIGAFDTTVERIEADLAAVFADSPPGEYGGAQASAREPALAASDGYDEDADDASGLAHGNGHAATSEDEDLDEIWRSGGLDLPALRRQDTAAMPSHRRNPAQEKGALPKPSAAHVSPADGDYLDPDLYEAGEIDDAPRPPSRRRRREDDGDQAGHEEGGARQNLAGHLLRLKDVLSQWRWRDLDDRGRTQLLIAAIASLSIILILIAGLAILSVFSGSGDEMAAPAPPGVAKRVASDPATAERIPNDSVKVTQSFVIFDGDDPTVFEASPDNPVRFDSDSSGAFARISSSSVAPGVRVNVGPGLAAKLAGHSVRVTIVARSARESGAPSFRFAYESGVAISHWQVANLKPDYMPFGMIWRVPAMRTDPNGDNILIEPGIPGDGTAVEIQSIKVDVIAP